MQPRLTLTNLSPLPRRAQAIATVPQAVVADAFGPECTFVSDKGHKWRAVRTAERGISHAVFRIVATMNGGESLTGSLIAARHPDADVPYQWHPWVNDDIAALIPQLGVARDPSGQVVDWSVLPGGWRMLEQSPVHQRIMLMQREPVAGFTFVWFADVHHLDPAIRVFGFPIWTNRADPETFRTFAGLVLRSGEYIALDFANRLGISAPVRDGAGKWQVLLASNITMKDGGAPPLSGHMLTLPSMPDKHVDTTDTSNNLALDLSSLKAAADGPIIAVSHGWDGRWLAHENVARFGADFIPATLSDAAWASFVRLLDTPGKFNTQRPLGIGLRPGATGNQEDFAATKGTFAVVAKDPRHIHAYNYSVMLDAMRGVMHYESDGATPLALDRHPQWVSWSSITHYSQSVSPDRLGKTAPVPFSDPSLVEGYDEEHRSQNNLAAYYTLSDDPRVPFLMRHQVTTDLAGYRFKFPMNGGGAARAYGREAQAWANLVGGADGDLLPSLLRLIANRWWLAASVNNPTFRDDLPFPVLGFHGPDGRKPIFADDGVSLIQTASIWEHGLALVGLYGTWKAGKLQGDTGAHGQVITKLCRLLAQWGCFLASDGWWFVADIAYFNGAAPTFELSKTTVGPKLTYQRGEVSSWTLAGMLVAVEWLDPSDPLRQRAKDCVDFFTQKREAQNLFDAEWWAAVRSVVFP